MYTSLLFGVGVILAIFSIIIFWSFTLQLNFLLVNSVISSSLKSSYRCLELALDFVDFAVVGVFTIMIGVFCRFWVLMQVAFSVSQLVIGVVCRFWVIDIAFIVSQRLGSLMQHLVLVRVRVSQRLGLGLVLVSGQNQGQFIIRFRI